MNTHKVVLVATPETLASPKINFNQQIKTKKRRVDTSLCLLSLDGPVDVRLQSH